MPLAALAIPGIKASIAITVLGLGLSASLRDATSLCREPTQLARSLLAMMVIVPLFAIVIARAFDLQPAVKIALCALAVSPVPPIWPRRAFKAGGDESYTIGLLVATAALSIFIIPIALAVFESIFSIPLQMSGAAIAVLTLRTVLVPLIIGIAIRRIWLQLAFRAARPVSLAGTGLLVVSALPVLVRAWPAMATLVGDGTLLTMLAFVLVGLLAGQVLGDRGQEEKSVLALASASRHPGIAIAIASANFPNEKLVTPAVLLYLFVSSIASTPYLQWSKRQGHRSRRPMMPIRSR